MWDWKSLAGLLLVLLMWTGLTAADRYGAKYIRNFNKKEYNSQPQNWTIRQDRRGFIHVANNGSLLIYDGVSWSETPLPRINPRSIAVDDSGTVYLGGYNDLGFLQQDAESGLQYVSLVNGLEGKYKGFSYVWQTYNTDEGVLFCTSKYLFLYHRERGSFTVITAQTSFSPPIKCNGKIYVRQKGVGLSLLKDGKLRPLRWGGVFAEESVYMIDELEPGTVLAGTRGRGFLLFKNGGFKRIETPGLKEAAAQRIFCGLRLTDGNVALGTQKKGVFVFDIEGRLIRRFDTGNGLKDNKVAHIFQDKDGNLWLAQVNWIAKIEYPSPFSFYHQGHGLPGMAYTVIRAGEQLYAGTGSGLFGMRPDERFEPVPAVPGTCFHLQPMGGKLAAATDKGIFMVNPDAEGNAADVEHITETASYVFFFDKRGRWPVLVGTQHGLTALTPSGNGNSGTPRTGPFLPEINGEIRTIAQDKQGSLWLGSPKQGVYRIDGPENPRVRYFDGSSFVPGRGFQVFYAAGHIITATDSGLFRWDERSAGFIPDTMLGSRFAGGKEGRSVKWLMADSPGNIWFHSKARNLLAVPRADGGYRIYEKKFLRIPFNTVNVIYADPLRPVVWFAGANGLMRVDSGIDPAQDSTFRTFIRRVTANGEAVAAAVSGNGEPELPFERRSLRFSFAAPFYEAEAQTLYRCRLEGYEADWTPWSSETRKDYTNLEPGLNVFRVQAKNVYGDTAGEAVFRFRVLAPWYRTWWAYTIYILCGVMLMWGVVKWRSAQLIREKQRLEGTVAQRTGEINAKNKQLEEMAAVKSRFFANISHEFRTPLTLILGPLDQMLEETEEPRRRKKFTLMRRNAQRLLNLINQLLELSKLDSGTVTLNASPRDMVSFLKGLTASFELLTTRRDQQLAFRAPGEEVMVYFDMSRMEEVIGNLLFNAVKFTPAGGEITVALSRHAPSVEEPRFPSGWIVIEVDDTGPGIPPDRVEQIFQRFYYSESTFEKEQKGAGIGLALAREWVELHGGDINAAARNGNGSRFTVRLPLGKEHLEPHEIADPGTDGNGYVQRSPTASDTGMPEEENGPENDGGVSEPFAGDREIILVAEDSPDVREYIREALEPAAGESAGTPGYKVIEAENGKEGIEKAFQAIPDLIVCDVMMPETDGIQLCRTLKRDRRTSHIPIILLTAKASEDSLLEGYETGADDYITKPFSIRVLHARIRNLIELRRGLQQDHRREMRMQPVKVEVSDVDRDFFKDLHAVIEENLEDPEFNVDQLAAKLYMGRTTVYRKITALCGETPTDYIRSYRLKRAARLLEEGNASVTEIAFEVGFNSRTYFSKCFKETFHCLPSDYRKSN